MINIFRQGLCHFHLWAFSLRHHQMARIEAGHGLPVAIDEIEVSFGSKDAPAQCWIAPGPAIRAKRIRIATSAFPALPLPTLTFEPYEHLYRAVLRGARAICFGTSLLAAPPPGGRLDLQLAISGRSGLVGWRTSLIWRADF